MDYEAETDGIEVRVRPDYVEERSNPREDLYFWAYSVTITNHSSQTVQLLARHWIITDARGQREEVQGPGVVGEQPILEPGQSFNYTSGCPLTTPSGIMAGTYEMIDGTGRTFPVVVPAFSLDQPGTNRTLN
jgi:ApaG protein